jgi:hypothetical protein
MGFWPNLARWERFRSFSCLSFADGAVIQVEPDLRCSWGHAMKRLNLASPPRMREIVRLSHAPIHATDVSDHPPQNARIHPRAIVTASFCDGGGDRG